MHLIFNDVTMGCYINCNATNQNALEKRQGALRLEALVPGNAEP